MRDCAITVALFTAQLKAKVDGADPIEAVDKLAAALPSIPDRVINTIKFRKNGSNYHDALS